jgi:hypothetical protein
MGGVVLVPCDVLIDELWGGGRLTICAAAPSFAPAATLFYSMVSRITSAVTSYPYVPSWSPRPG